MIAGLRDPAAIHHDDLVGHVHRAEAVRDQHGDRAPGGAQGRLAVAGEQGGLARGVQAGGRLVEHDEQRPFPHQAAGQSQPLPLAAGQRPPADVGAEQGVEPESAGLAVALSLSGHQVPRAGPADRAEHGLPVVDAEQVTGAHPVAERHGEPDEVLERAGRGLAPADRADAGQVPSVDQDPSLGRAVHAGQQLDQGRLSRAVLPHDRDGGAGLQVQAYVGECRVVLARVGESDVLQADAVGQFDGRGLARLPPETCHVVLEPQQPVGRGGCGRERPGAGAGPGHLPLGPAQQADHLDHGAGRGVAVRGPQDQGHDSGTEARRVQDPPGRLPHRGHVRGPQRLPVNLVAEPDVPGQQPVGHPEGTQLPGRGRRRGQCEQVVEQTPAIGQVVIGALLHLGRLPVGHGRRDGQQRDHHERRPDQGEQHGRAHELDCRAQHAQGLGRRARQGPAALPERLELFQVVGPLEVLQVRRLAGQIADPQAEAQVGQVDHLGVEGAADQLQHPAGRESDGGDDQAGHDEPGLMPVGAVHDGPETERVGQHEQRGA